MVQNHKKDVWKFIILEYGDPFVTMVSRVLVQVWHVLNSDMGNSHIAIGCIPRVTIWTVLEMNVNEFFLGKIRIGF